MERIRKLARDTLRRQFFWFMLGRYPIPESERLHLMRILDLRYQCRESQARLARAHAIMQIDERAQSAT